MKFRLHYYFILQLNYPEVGKVNLKTIKYSSAEVMAMNPTKVPRPSSSG